MKKQLTILLFLTFLISPLQAEKGHGHEDHYQAKPAAHDKDDSSKAIVHAYLAIQKTLASDSLEGVST